MDILQLAREIRSAADLIVIDRDGHSLLFIEIKARTGYRDRSIPILVERSHRFGFPYGMFVDPEAILIYRDGHPEPVASLSTAEAIRPYDADYNSHRRWIFHDYLQAMIESWLADYATSWRHREPPHHAKLAEIGLAERLAGARIGMSEESIP